MTYAIPGQIRTKIITSTTLGVQTVLSLVQEQYWT